jgi:flagellar basal body-associated protein FliL
MASPGVNLFHALAVGPGLALVGYKCYNASKSAVTFEESKGSLKVIGIALLVVALLMIIAHIALYISKMIKADASAQKSTPSFNVVNEDGSTSKNE